MLRAALPVDERIDVMVPVPMHWWKRLRRGFNQSERIARVLARRAKLPLKTDILRRVRGTRVQAGLTHTERQANIAGAFRIRSKQPLQGKRVLLVDDVFTTGATASACAKALKKAGASSVVLLTLAHVDRRWAVVSAGDKFPGESENGHFDQTAEAGARIECEL